MSAIYSDEEIKRCTLTGRREILFYIRLLIRNSPRIIVTFEEGLQSFPSLLVDVSADESTLYFDLSGSELSNRALLQSSLIQCSGSNEGIPIQFSSGRPKLSRAPGGAQAFAVPMPTSMLRLQRRDTFRLPLPSAKPYLCHLRGLPEEVILPVSDISIGGLRLLLTEEPTFEPLQRIEQCLLDLRDFGALPIDLEVRYIQSGQGSQNKPLWALGCCFYRLSSAMETSIQRFMAKIEIERRALAAK